MWVVSGPFDGKTPGDVGFTKRKLLNCGQSYQLGRKPKATRPLVVHHPKVSAELVDLVVGGHSTEQVMDPGFVPRLMLHNLSKKDKSLLIQREGGDVIVPSGGAEEIKDGDSVALVTAVKITIRWKPICCLVSPKDIQVPFAICAKMGLKVIPEQDHKHDAPSHHVSTALALTPSIVTSLIGASQLVSLAWLTELIQHGTCAPAGSANSEAAQSALEGEYLLPTESRHRPPFLDGLPDELKRPKVWEPDEERVTLLRGWSFVWVGKGDAGKEVQEMAHRAGAKCEMVDVAGGRVRAKQVLNKVKQKAEEGGKGIACVAEDSTRGLPGWDTVKAAFDEAALVVFSPKNVYEAVAAIDTGRINSLIPKASEEERELKVAASGSKSKPQPDAEVEMEVEQEAPPPARRLLRRRVTPSREPTPQPGGPERERAKPKTPPPPIAEEQDADVEPEPAPPPRRNLVRRLDKKAVVGVDDPSVIESQPPNLDGGDNDEPAAALKVPLTPSSRSSRLKRRVGTTQTNPVLSSVIEDTLDPSTAPDGPPLKRFKALFDEDEDSSNGGTGTALGMTVTQENAMLLPQSQYDTIRMVPGYSRATGVGSATQDTQTQSGVDRVVNPRSRIREEVEESQAPSQLPDNGANVKKGAVEPPTKKARFAGADKENTARIVSETQTQAVAGPSKTTGTAAKGAPPGKPDTDTAFLKAVSTKRRGAGTAAGSKGKEDDFDRDFNNLRISKPDLQTEERAEEWKVLEEFGDDGDLRGNFMVVVELPIYNASQGSQARRVHNGTRMDWEGRPDYKKFNKKAKDGRAPMIDLVLQEENDYGMGSVYWQGGSQTTTSQPLPSQSQRHHAHRESSPNAADITNYFAPQARSKSAKPPSKSKAPSTQTGTQRAQPKLRVIDSDLSDFDDEKEVPKKGKGKAAPARKTAAKTKAPPKGKGKQPLFLASEDDDDDDGGGDGAFDDEMDEEATLGSNSPQHETQAKSGRGTAREQPTRAGKRKAPPVVVDDDSDDDVTFKGFGGGKGAKRARVRG